MYPSRLGRIGNSCLALGIRLRLKQTVHRVCFYPTQKYCVRIAVYERNLPSHVRLSINLYPGLQSHRKPMGISIQICEHPPLFFRHSFMPQSTVLSSSQPMQSGFLSHTLWRGMQEPWLHSNWVRGSQACVLFVQFFSSLPSGHSALPLQYRWPELAMKLYYRKFYTYIRRLSLMTQLLNRVRTSSSLLLC